jgi:hypothetical protein
VVLADEIDRAKPDVQNAWLQYLFGRTINGHTISPNVYLVSTMNGSADIWTTPLSKAARTRMCHVYVSGAAEGALDSWSEWASHNDVHPLIQGFSRFRPDLIKYHEDYEQFAEAGDRQKVLAGQILFAAEKVSFNVDDILEACLAGVVGREYAGELMGYRDLFYKCPKPEVILKDPDKAVIPEEPSIMYAVCAALCSHSKGDRAKAQQCVKYMRRMPEHLAALGLQRLGSTTPSVVTTQEYIEWCESNPDIIM